MIAKKGTVIKISSAQTIKVEVNEYRSHPRYKKRYRVTRRFLVHDEDNKAKVGESVVITQTRPISKRKHWCLSSEKVTNKK